MALRIEEYVDPSTIDKDAPHFLWYRSYVISRMGPVVVAGTLKTTVDAILTNYTTKLEVEMYKMIKELHTDAVHGTFDSFGFAMALTEFIRNHDSDFDKEL